MKAVWLVLAGVAAGAVGGWFAQGARVSDLEDRLLEKDRDLTEVSREAQMWKQSAASELQRVREVREQLEEIRIRQIPPARDAAGAPRPSSEAPRPETSRKPPAPPPETWDLVRFKRELHMLAARAEHPRKDVRWKAVVAAAEANGEPVIPFLRQLLASSQEPSMHMAVAALVEALKAEEAVPELVVCLASSTDERVVPILTEALARLPGDAQVDALLGVWNDEEAPVAARRAAMQGLGDRVHPAALEVAAGNDPKSTPPMRHIALGKLLVKARAGDFQDAQYPPVFVKALSNVDGTRQAAVVLEALEGYWDKANVQALLQFAVGELADPETRARAKVLAADIASGKRRPPNAGGRKQGKRSGNRQRGMRRRPGSTTSPKSEAPPSPPAPPVPDEPEEDL